MAAAPEFTHYADSGYTGWQAMDRVWWKLAAAERVALVENRPLIWTDDDIAYERRSPRSDLPTLLSKADILAISPTSSVGLTRKNLRAVTDFLHLDIAALLPDS